MPPDMDIYVLTKQRNRPIIDGFIADFVDRAASEQRGNEELMMVPLITDTTTPQGDEWEWEPVSTLSHVIERGLDHPRRAFTIRLTPKDKTIDHAWLAFTTDDQLVVGVALDDASELPETAQRARSLLAQMAQQSEASLGVILVEEPPPLSEDAFERKERTSLTIHFWRRDVAY